MVVAPDVLGEFVHTRNNSYMASGASHLDYGQEGWAPYAIFGIYLGLLPVFVALVITRLPL